MREITIEVGVYEPPVRVMGRVCTLCPPGLKTTIFPLTSYWRHVKAHSQPVNGRVCVKCKRPLPWGRFPRTSTGIAAACYHCRRLNRGSNRGRPKGTAFKKTGIRSTRVWGPGQDEESS